MKKIGQKDKEEHEKQKVSGFPGTAVVCIMELLMTAVAAVLIFVSRISTIDICYILCAAVVAFGIYMIVRYFMTDTFRNLNEYGFSVGTLFVVLGICGMIRAASLAAVFFTCIGVIMLFSCVIKLQYALDLKRIGDKLWFLVLIVTFGLICCSIAVILNPFSSVDLYSQFSYRVLLADGGISLLIILYLMIRIKLLKRQEWKKLKAEAAEAEKAEAEEAEAEKAEAEKTEAEKTEAEKTEAEKTEAEKTEAEKTEAEKPEADRQEVQKSDPGEQESKNI